MKYTKDILERAVKDVNTWSDLCRYFNVSPTGGSHPRLKNLVLSYGIDYSHFTGRAATYKVKTKAKYQSIEEFLKNGFISSHKLRIKLIEFGVKEEKCEICGLTEWLGNKIPLDLDHINGNNTDNRLENLRILCKNCHGQTETFGSKKLKLHNKKSCKLCNIDIAGKGKYCNKCRVTNASSIFIKK